MLRRSCIRLQRLCGFALPVQYIAKQIQRVTGSSMHQKITPHRTLRRRELLEMNVSLAFVDQGLGPARGGFFGPSEKRRRRAEIPFTEFAQPKRQIAGCLRRASNGADARDKK